MQFIGTRLNYIKNLKRFSKIFIFTFLTHIASAQGDDCTSATSLTVGTSCSSSTYDITGLTGSGVANPACSSYGDPDGWFSFTAPANGMVEIETAAGSISDLAMALYGSSMGTCATLNSNEIACDDDSGSGLMPHISASGLTSGETYWVRVWEYGGGTVGTFDVCIFSPTPPSNDDCGGAISLTQNATCTTTAGTVAYATSSGSACSAGGTADDDVWYSFTATSVSVQIDLSSSFDAVIELLDGCSGTSLYCQDYPESIEATGLTPSNTYYVRIYSVSATAPSTPTFDICVYDPPAPPNDDVCSSTSLPVGCAVNYTNATTSGATNSSNASPTCGDYQGKDVWFSFVAPISGSVVVATQAQSITDGAMTLYAEGAMGCSSLSAITCDENSGAASMPGISATGLIAGDTYYIRFWEEGGNVEGDFDISVHDPSQTYCLYGDAILYTPAGHVIDDNCAQMTAEANDETGCIWASNQIDFGSDFDYTFSMYFGNNISGADGCTFTFQNEGPDVCGAAGAQLGAGGISNSVIIEFDTYDNDGTTNDDLSDDHIAVEIDGDLPDDPVNFPSNAAPLCGPVTAKSGGGNIDDGNEYAIRVTWNSASQTLEIYFDGVLRLSCSHDFVTNVFGGDPTVYWGFTGATGGLNNQQWFCPGSLPLAAVDLAYFNVECDGSNNKLSWTALDEGEAAYIIERSYDGTSYEQLETINTKDNAYFVWYDKNVTGNPYYRIKQYEDYQKPVFSPIKRADCLGNRFEMDAWMSQNNMMIRVQNIDVSGLLDIIDVCGRIVVSTTVNSGTSTLSFPMPEASGLYLVSLQTAEGMHLSQRVMKR